MAGAGDFIVIPSRTIHHETTSPDGDLDAFVFRVGSEPERVDVDGPAAPNDWGEGRPLPAVRGTTLWRPPRGLVASRAELKQTDWLLKPLQDARPNLSEAVASMHAEVVHDVRDKDLPAARGVADPAR